MGKFPSSELNSMITCRPLDDSDSYFRKHLCAEDYLAEDAAEEDVDDSVQLDWPVEVQPWP